MGPYHEFLLLDKNNYPVNRRIFDHIDKVRGNAILLDDDLVMYMIDTLLWMPSAPGREMGLNYYNTTVLEQLSAPYLKTIVDAWFTLFSLAPEDEINLTGCWTIFIDEDNEDDGYYAKLSYPKQDVLASLKAISEMAEAVIKDDNLYILHLGI